MKTAGEVNAAILESMSQGKEVKLVGLLKLLCWGETMLEEKAEFPKVRETTVFPKSIDTKSIVECNGWYFHVDIILSYCINFIILYTCRLN